VPSGQMTEENIMEGDTYPTSVWGLKRVMQQPPDVRERAWVDEPEGYPFTSSRRNFDASRPRVAYPK
jgi:hypothetical protein